MAAGKKYTAAKQQVENRPYTVPDAMGLLKKIHYVKFNETVELHVRLGVDPKHADQMVRGTVVLPHGLGKSKKVCVIASGEKIKEAESAGAEVVGGDDLVEKIAGGWVDFEACIATPDMMRSVGKLGKVLGPRGLMPNPKTGSVTFEVAKAIKEVKAGKVEFRVDKTGIIHAPVGKIEFSGQQLSENAQVLIDSVIKARPAAVKGRYVKRITVAGTMSPGIDLDLVALDAK
jgi:large subunit ribosomal protein L1